MKVKKHTVLITGGASGIGKIMSRLMLERGAEKVIIWDINQESIDMVTKEFNLLGKIEGYQVDVTNLEQIKQTAERCKHVDILINCAGIVVGKFFNEHTDNDIRKEMEVNAIAPMNVAKAFLDDMFERNFGQICNIASAAGLLANPKMSVYAASKWSIIGWSDSLRVEMLQQKKNIHITTVLPYYINTGMFDGVQSLLPILKPEKAATAIVNAIESNKKMITIPRYMYSVSRLAQGLLSIGGFDWFAGKFLGIYNTMKYFTGRVKQ